MPDITVNQQSGGSSAATNPRVTVGNRIATGDYIHVLIAQQSADVPGVPTDSLGNTYRQCGGAASTNDGSLTVVRYHCLSAAAGKPQITLPTDAPCVYGYFTASNVAALGRGSNPESSCLNIFTPQDTSYVADAQTVNVGDLIAAVIFSLGQVTFTLTDNPATPASAWGSPASASTPQGSVQFVTISPNPAGYAAATWSAPAPGDAIAAAVALAHS
jgi:hypothetical protein